MNLPSRTTCCTILATVAAAAATFSIWTRPLRADAPAGQPLPIRTEELNAGKYVLVGRLDRPLGKYHVVRATFGVPNFKGRAGSGGRLHLRVSELDGQKLSAPVWLPYYKSMTLQTYKLADGTDIFPDARNVQSLQGKSIVCKVCETVDLLDTSGDVSEHYGNTDKPGFDRPYYQTSLGILHVIH